jgi:4-hydroxybenzoate polyprenyltransferase
MSSLANILWAVVAVIVILWLIGLFAGILGGFIHILLVIAAIIIVYNLLTGRRTP